MSLGENIKHFRESNNMTIKEFAEKMGVQRTTIVLWEADKTAPKLGKLVAMCDVLSCDVDDLMIR